MTFTRADLRFLHACGVSTKGMRAVRECALECQQIFSQPLDGTEQLDGTCRILLELGLPLTAENWMRLQFAGNPPTPPLDGELLAELPDWVRRAFEEED